MQRISVSDKKDIKSAFPYHTGYDVEVSFLIRAFQCDEHDGKNAVVVKDGILVPTNGNTHKIPVQDGHYELRYPSGRVIHYWVNN